MPGAATANRDTANTSEMAEQKDGGDDVIEPHRATFPLEITDAYRSSHFYLDILLLVPYTISRKEALIKPPIYNVI